MYDFLESSKKLTNRDFFDNSSLKKIDEIIFGYQKYELIYKRPIIIWFNPTEGVIKVKGSIPYFWQGHNYSQNQESFTQAISYISTMVGVDIWPANLLHFEYGKTIQVDESPEVILKNHLGIGVKTPGINNKCKFFEYQGNTLKVYDAVHNYKCKVPIEIRRNHMKDAGMQEALNYVRIEKYYKLPLKFFGRQITIQDLLFPHINNWCRRDLYQHYKRIEINTGFRLPELKKHLKSSHISFFALNQVILNTGFDGSAKGLIWDIIKNSTALNKDDKKARKRQMTKMFDLVNVDDDKYNLATTLIRKIAADRF